MIYISQGHEKSIGLEIFFKAFQQISKSKQEQCLLACHRDSLAENLKNCHLKHSYNENEIQFENSVLNIKLLEKSNLSETMNSLNYCLDHINKNDSLFTLPSSKDQFVLNGTQFLGHTEYFRHQYKNSDLAMVFQFDDILMLLLTDHIPLKEVTSKINKKLVFSKINLCLNIFSNLKEVFIAGVNPHGGENGLFGLEDDEITKAVNKLRQNFPAISFSGPLAGDSLFINPKQNCLYVSTFHDQGLSAFKSKFGFLGSHLTLGLPFKRYSVDHGTAFELYGKNKADYRGCLNVLNSI